MAFLHLPRRFRCLLMFRFVLDMRVHRHRRRPFGCKLRTQSRTQHTTKLNSSYFRVFIWCLCRFSFAVCCVCVCSSHRRLHHISQQQPVGSCVFIYNNKKKSRWILISIVFLSADRHGVRSTCHDSHAHIQFTPFQNVILIDGGCSFIHGACNVHVWADARARTTAHMVTKAETKHKKSFAQEINMKWNVTINVGILTEN